MSPESPASKPIPSKELDPSVAVDRILTPHVTTAKERQRAFFILFFSIMCLGMGQSIVFTVLPGVARSHLGFTEFQTDMIFSLSSVVWIISSPFWGRRSDRIGRKPVILIGMTGFSLSILLFGLIEGAGILKWWQTTAVYAGLICARSIYGLLGPGAQAGAQAYVIDRSPREKRTEAIANLSAAWGTGTILGPGIGAMLVVFGLIAPFFFLAAFGFACVAAIVVLLPERTPPKMHRDLPRIRITDRRVAAFVGFGTITAMVQAIPTQTISFYMTDVLKLDPAHAVQLVGVGLMCSAMAGLFAQLVLVQRFRLSPHTLTLAGLCLALVSSVLIAVSRQYGPMVTALVLNGLGFGMCRPGISAAASLSVTHHEQGGVAGAMVGTGGAGFILCSLAAVPLYAVSHQAPFMLGAALLGVLIVLFFLLPDFKRDLTAVPEDPTVDVTVGRG